MKPTKVAVLGKVVKEFFKGLTYVSIIFTDGTGIQIEVAQDWNGDVSVEVYEYDA